VGGPRPRPTRILDERELLTRIAKLEERLRALRIVRAELQELQRKHASDTAVATLLLSLEKILDTWEAKVVEALHRARSLLASRQ